MCSSRVPWILQTPCYLMLINPSCTLSVQTILDKKLQNIGFSEPDISLGYQQPNSLFSNGYANNIRYMVDY